MALKSACPTCGSCSVPGQSTLPHPGLFLALGLLGGVLGGIALSHRLSAPQELAAFKIWRREMAKTHGAVKAGFLSARISQVYDALYADRPRFDRAALRSHTEDHILPGLALYQVLREEYPDRDSALSELDRLLEAQMNASMLRMQARLLSLLPDPFAFFRFYITQMLTRQYPQSEWAFRWVENSPDVVAFDATDCFYLRVLTAYGAPELTAHFCRLDDVMMTYFPLFAWKRTGTIGRGDPVCDFRYERKKDKQAV